MFGVQLENYLNDGGIVIEETRGNKVPVSVYAESTPNPAVMKFVANKPLVTESVEFKTIDEAKNAPLAQKLFHFPFVKEVFISANYVSLTKYEVATSWEEVVMEIQRVCTFIYRRRKYYSYSNILDLKDVDQKSSFSTKSRSSRRHRLFPF